MDISIDLSMVLLSSAISDPIHLISEHRSLQEAPYTYVKTGQFFVYWVAASHHARWPPQQHQAMHFITFSPKTLPIFIKLPPFAAKKICKALNVGVKLSVSQTMALPEWGAPILGLYPTHNALFNFGLCYLPYLLTYIGHVSTLVVLSNCRRKLHLEI
jgi:hypothetical protein